jgi:hypothetical protein
MFPQNNDRIARPRRSDFFLDDRNRQCLFNCPGKHWEAEIWKKQADRDDELQHSSEPKVEAISKMLSPSPFDAPDFVGIAQGEQIAVHPD